MTEVEQQPQTNGIETIGEEDDSSKVRPADIEAVRMPMQKMLAISAPGGCFS